MNTNGSVRRYPVDELAGMMAIGYDLKEVRYCAPSEVAMRAQAERLPMGERHTVRLRAERGLPWPALTIRRHGGPGPGHLYQAGTVDQLGLAVMTASLIAAIRTVQTTHS